MHTEARRLIPRRLLKGTETHHPAVVEEAIRRNQSLQLRIADRITTFAGSMSLPVNDRLRTVSCGSTPCCSPCGCWFSSAVRGRR